MTYPKPGEVALYARDGETVLSSEQYDHVGVNDHYVRLEPTVRDPAEPERGERRSLETMYVPWDRVHMIRRDYTEETDE